SRPNKRSMIREQKWPHPRGIGASDPRKVDYFPGRGNRRSLQQAQLLIPTGPVGVVGCERLLGEDVEAGEQAEGLVTVEVVDMTAPLLIEQFQPQQREQGACGGGQPPARATGPRG